MAELYQYRNGKAVLLDTSGGATAQIVERVNVLESRADIVESRTEELETDLGGISGISDTLDSTSTETAASSLAVKTLHDSLALLEKAVDLGQAAGTVTLDPGQGRIFSATVTGDVTLNISEIQPGVSLLLILAGASNHVVTWGMEPRWTGGMAPILGSLELVALTCGPDNVWNAVHVATNLG